MIGKCEMKDLFIGEATREGRSDQSSRPSTQPHYLTDKADLSRGFPPGLSYRS